MITHVKRRVSKKKKINKKNNQKWRKKTERGKKCNK